MKDSKPEILTTGFALAAATLLKVFDATSLNQSIIIFLVSASIVLMFIQIFKNRKLVSEVKNFDLIGIREVNKPHTEMDLKKQLIRCKESFVFWGVSARTIINQEGVNLIRTKYFQNPNIVFKFLLLDPREDEVGKKRAKEETGNEKIWDSWKKIISGSMEELAALKNEIPKLNIEIRIYRTNPIFRMLEVDNSEIYLNFYCSNIIPTELPNFHLIRKPNSFYYAIEKSFEDSWNISEVVLDKVTYKVLDLKHD